ncbi:VOC family protein [Actinoplanes siamensis]|uniref:VOC domain-containing protein n=1 Tax=Actinoplanes siamensis TaxID=1223317 RepID=A0A919TKG1_9ACTN|nr:VOC family protein [Actinoplanes siamensis]GIF05125.1 hypothetical protein Asi03nite_26630 [Actinoplanes siamensis]
MDFTLVGVAFAASDPAASARWFAEHFGFTVTVDLGWYVSLHHESHTGLSVDLVHRDHESWPDGARGREVAGTLFALMVADVDAEHERLRTEGVAVLRPPVTEPWGQRRCQLAGPDGLVVEILQRVAPDPAWLAANGFGA